MFDGREYLISDSKYMKLNLEFPHEEIAKEAIALRDRYVEYRSTYQTKGWHSLPIVGISSQHPYAWNVYGEFKSAKDAAPLMKFTEVADLCPVTTNWLKNVYPSSSYARVRFMLLEAGGVIEPHSDTEHSVLGAINIAITNPKNCKWHWEDGESLEFKPGDVYAMNTHYTHSIRNESNEDRYHMIVHHYDSTEAWKNLFLESMKEQNVQGEFRFSTELF